MVCINCSNSKKRILVISSIGGGIAITSYASFVLNSALATAILPIILSFAACIVMCVVMGGARMLSSRLSNKKLKETSDHSSMMTKSEEKKYNKKFWRN